jgi:hypothetical protein
MIILEIRNLEVKKNGPTEIRKAQEGQAQPKTARIL